MSEEEEHIKNKTHKDEDNKANSRTRQQQQQQQNIPPPYYYHNRNKKEEKEIGIWGILLFGLIGATATTLAVCILNLL